MRNFSLIHSPMCLSLTFWSDYNALYFSSIFSCWDNVMGMVRGVAAVGATGTAAARGFFNLFCFGGGARGALDAVLQARLLAQYRAMIHQFGAAAPLSFFLPPPDLVLFRGTGGLGKGKGVPVAGPHPLPRLHGCKRSAASSAVLSTKVASTRRQFAGVGDGVGMDDWGASSSAVAVGGGERRGQRTGVIGYIYFQFQ